MMLNNCHHSYSGIVAARTPVNRHRTTTVVQDKTVFNEGKKKGKYKHTSGGEAALTPILGFSEVKINRKLYRRATFHSLNSLWYSSFMGL